MVRRQLHQRCAFTGRAEGGQVDPPREDAVLDVVHRVRDVVGPVHDLGLEAAPPVGGTVAHPREHGGVGEIGAELPDAGSLHPRVLAGGVQRRAGEVQPAAVDLGLQPGEDPQRLRVAFEPAAGRTELVEGPLAVVPERRVPDVMGEPGGVDDVRIAPQLLGHPTADLRHLQRVGEPRAGHAGDLGSLAGPDDLGLTRQPAQRSGVQDAGAVAGERAAAVRARALRAARAASAGAGRWRSRRVGSHGQPSPLVSVSTEAWVSR